MSAVLKSADCALTPRETEVMHLLGSGLVYKQIATKLGCSKRTVDIHAASMFEKIGVRGLVNFGRWYERTYGNTQVLP
jgi:DNA-binding NarL/FixJ family response regulator